ncbi:hypothetical protein TNCV_1840541 [Trichonephila clavipes]|nr:hypothetical protein TNCV_1840541 [Trichonephila clavipes]
MDKACPEFEPSIAEDPPCWWVMHVKSVDSRKSPCWCDLLVRRRGCQFRCRPRHLTMVQNYEVQRQKPSCS